MANIGLGELNDDSLGSVLAFVDAIGVGRLWLSGNRSIQSRLSRTSVISSFEVSFKGRMTGIWPILMEKFNPRHVRISCPWGAGFMMLGMDLKKIPKSVESLELDYGNASVGFARRWPEEMVTCRPIPEDKKIKMVALASLFPHLKRFMISSVVSLSLEAQEVAHFFPKTLTSLSLGYTIYLTTDTINILPPTLVALECRIDNREWDPERVRFPVGLEELELSPVIFAHSFMALLPRSLTSLTTFRGERFQEKDFEQVPPALTRLKCEMGAGGNSPSSSSSSTNSIGISSVLSALLPRRLLILELSLPLPLNTSPFGLDLNFVTSGMLPPLLEDLSILTSSFQPDYELYFNGEPLNISEQFKTASSILLQQNENGASSAASSSSSTSSTSPDSNSPITAILYSVVSQLPSSLKRFSIPKVTKMLEDLHFWHLLPRSLSTLTSFNLHPHNNTLTSSNDAKADLSSFDSTTSHHSPSPSPSFHHHLPSSSQEHQLSLQIPRLPVAHLAKLVLCDFPFIGSLHVPLLPKSLQRLDLTLNDTTYTLPPPFCVSLDPEEKPIDWLQSIFGPLQAQYLFQEIFPDLCASLAKHLTSLSTLRVSFKFECYDSTNTVEDLEKMQQPYKNLSVNPEKSIHLLPPFLRSLTLTEIPMEVDRLDWSLPWCSHLEKFKYSSHGLSGLKSVDPTTPRKRAPQTLPILWSRSFVYRHPLPVGTSKDDVGRLWWASLPRSLIAFHTDTSEFLPSAGLECLPPMLKKLVISTKDILDEHVRKLEVCKRLEKVIFYGEGDGGDCLSPQTLSALPPSLRLLKFTAPPRRFGFISTRRNGGGSSSNTHSHDEARKGALQQVLGTKNSSMEVSLDGSINDSLYHPDRSKLLGAYSSTHLIYAVSKHIIPSSPPTTTTP